MKKKDIISHHQEKIKAALESASEKGISVLAEEKCNKVLTRIAFNNNKYLHGYESNLIKLDDDESKQKHLSVAILSLPLSPHLEPKQPPKGFYGEKIKYFRINNEYIPYHFELIEKAVNHILSSKIRKPKPQFIMLNELAFITGRSKVAKDFQSKLNCLFEKLAKKNIFIIGGSYHCDQSRYGICPIFTPPDAQKPPKRHKKQTTAIKQEEHIRTPNVKRLSYYKSRYGKFAIMLCLDSYDMSLVMKFFHDNYRVSKRFSFADDLRERETPILFIPSMNSHNEKASDVAKDISFGAGCFTFFTNCCALSEEDKTPIHGFHFGSPLDPAYSKTFSVDYQNQTMNAYLKIFKEPWAKHRETKANAEKLYSASFRSVVGYGSRFINR